MDSITASLRYWRYGIKFWHFSWKSKYFVCGSNFKDLRQQDVNVRLEILACYFWWSYFKEEGAQWFKVQYYFLSKVLKTKPFNFKTKVHFLSWCSEKDSALFCWVSVKAIVGSNATYCPIDQDELCTVEPHRNSLKHCSQATFTSFIKFSSNELYFSCSETRAWNQ